MGGRGKGIRHGFERIKIIVPGLMFSVAGSLAGLSDAISIHLY